jgi:GT2 family glycosyltransferase
MPPVCVVIVSYRTPRLTLNAVKSALSSGVDEVVVVDNDSQDTSVAVLGNVADPRLKVLVNSVNLGFGTAANWAVRESSAPSILFLNSDATLTPAACATLLAELTEHDGRCVVGPRLVGSDGGIQRSAGLLPRPSDLGVRALGMHRLGALIRRLPVVGRTIGASPMAREYEIAIQATESTDVTMVSGACFVIGRDAFMEIGGFDERFFLYFEDADLCRRAIAARMSIRYVPSAQVAHVGGASSPDDYHFGPFHARSMRQYLGKWYGWKGSMLALALLWMRAMGTTLALRPSARSAWASFQSAVRDEDPRP